MIFYIDIYIYIFVFLFFALAGRHCSHEGVCTKLARALDSIPRELWGTDKRKGPGCDKANVPALHFGLAKNKTMQMKFLTKCTQSCEHYDVLSLIHDIVNLWPDKNFCYTSFHVSRDHVCDAHVDSGNCGPALTFTVGDFEGGELGICVPSYASYFACEREFGKEVNKKIDIQNKLTLTNVHWKHWTEDFVLKPNAHRNVVVVYSMKEQIHMEPSDPQCLLADFFGFRLWGCTLRMYSHTVNSIV